MEFLINLSLKYGIIPYHNDEENLAFTVLKLKGKQIMETECDQLKKIITKEKLMNTHNNRNKPHDICYDELFDRVRFNRPP